MADDIKRTDPDDPTYPKIWVGNVDDRLSELAFVYSTSDGARRSYIRAGVNRLKALRMSSYSSKKISRG